MARRKNQAPAAAPAPAPVPLVDEKRASLDVLCARGARLLIAAVEQQTRINIWDAGAGEVIDQVIRENVPKQELSPMVLARGLGLVKGGSK